MKVSISFITSNDFRRRFAASCEGIQDSLGFWVPRRGFQIPGT